MAVSNRPSVAVFVCSSDSRRDVLVRVLPSLFKFWPDCPYPIYLGLNSRDRTLQSGTHVLAPASEWYRECTTQLAQLEEEYLVVLLDDFLIHTFVDQARVEQLVEDASTLDLAYLRLLPLGRSIGARLTGVRLPELKPGIERIPVHRPFYSGLRIAIWRRQYLQTMFENPLSIWEFEHHHIPGPVHCAITDRPPIVYRHLVEKGRWLPDARSLLKQAGLSTELGARPTWPRSKYAQLFLDQVRWHLLGYSTC